MQTETQNRTLRTIEIFKISIGLICEVWTNPNHILNWWGPTGFTTTIHKMEVKEGVEWNLTMHVPEGAYCPIRSIFKEIIALY
jgi:uncharacterized protein YndB with AHSA1/START domain